MNITANSVIDWNPQYITVDGKPYFPVMGEIHYSRVKKEHWERELLKMKAGGVDIASCYAIWIHHEEIEGEWDFTGNRDLRTFLETVKTCGMHCILRIGPWAHGEVRNGGFPDWLVDREKTGKMRLRSDDPAYLACARAFYEHIYAQAEGLFLKQDGPIIGIQIENEYGHCGGQTGEEGEQHMRTLMQMAKEIGFDAPLYTATGWGGAVTGGMLPVMGGYCEAPWDQRTTEIEPSGNYIFTKERNDHNIGSDHGLGAGITFDMDAFPYLTAELGGGLQVTKHRRPVASAKDTIGMSMVKLGSGCNLLGYYMYHGGSNPEGKLTTLQETRKTGYPNDLPVRSYDFNAPIREYGQLTDTYREIRRLTMFTKDYEDLLCRSRYVPQPGNPEKPDNLSAVRSAVRLHTETDEEGRAYHAGFYFLNNYQRRYTMEEHDSYTPTAYDSEGNKAAIFDVCDLKDGDLFFRPFNLKIGEAVLRSTNVVPLCILNKDCSEDQVYVFYARSGVDPDYRIKGNLGNISLLTLTDEEALHAFKAVLDGKEYLFVSEDDIVPAADGTLNLISEVRDTHVPKLRVWPELPACPKGFRQSQKAGRMRRTAAGSVLAEYVYEGELVNRAVAEMTSSVDVDGCLKADIVLNRQPQRTGENVSIDETMLYIAYAGESAELMQGDWLAADNFYTGQVWEIGAADLCTEESGRIQAVIHPLRETDREHLYLQEWPDMSDGTACRIEQISTGTVYRLEL